MNNNEQNLDENGEPKFLNINVSNFFYKIEEFFTKKLEEFYNKHTYIEQKLTTIETFLRKIIMNQNDEQAAFDKLTATVQKQTDAITAENAQITESLAEITTLVGTLENPDTSAIVARINTAIDKIQASTDTVTGATTSLASATTAIIQVPVTPPPPPPPPPPATVSPTDSSTLQ